MIFIASPEIFTIDAEMYQELTLEQYTQSEITQIKGDHHNTCNLLGESRHLVNIGENL